MDAFKSLPKDFIITYVLKAILGLLGLITVGSALVIATVAFLYLNSYPFWTILLGGCAAWMFFLLIIAVFMYHKQTRYHSKLALILSLFNKQAMASVALHAVNSFFHKKPPKEQSSQE